MWRYEKRLQYPVKICMPNAKLAQAILSQLGGPDGELAASQRYLSQRYAMPCRDAMGLLTDIGTEEMNHLEIVSAMIRQLTKDLSMEEIRQKGFAPYYVDHTLGVYPASGAGVPFTATYFQSKGDPITDLHENMAAEQKARTTYDNLIRIADDADVLDALKFLRAREVVHYQRFGEMLRMVTERQEGPHVYAMNMAFD